MSGAVTRCPSCGTPLPGRPSVEWLARQHPSGTFAAILRALGGGAELSAEAVASRVYADHADGGPDTASNVVRALIYKHRADLAPYGWAIATQRGPGGGYRLVMADLPGLPSRRVAALNPPLRRRA